MSDEKRELQTIRIYPSVMDKIRTQSKILGMSLGEFIEYSVQKELIPGMVHDHTIVEIAERIMDLRTEFELVYEELQLIRDGVVAKSKTINEDELSEWMDRSTRKLSVKNTPSKVLFDIIQEGVALYDLTDYGISVLENAYNDKVKIRE